MLIYPTPMFWQQSVLLLYQPLQLSIYPHSFSINDCIKKCHVRSIRATYTHIQNLYSASLYYTVVQNFMHFDWAKLHLFGNKLAKSGKNPLISVVLKRQKNLLFFKFFLAPSQIIYLGLKKCGFDRGKHCKSSSLSKLHFFSIYSPLYCAQHTYNISKKIESLWREESKFNKNT